MPVASFSLPASRDGLSLCRSSWELCAAAASKGAERRAARRERKTKRGRSLPAAILVDLDRRNLIRRLREAQGVDGISFTVHPLVGKLNTVRPWLRPIGAIDGSHAVVASTGCSPVLQTVRGRVPECQGGDSLLRRRQEGAVAAPQSGAPRRRHGHRPRGAGCGLGGHGRMEATSIVIAEGWAPGRWEHDASRRRCSSSERGADAEGEHAGPSP